MTVYSSLSDEELLRRVETLAASERDVTTQLIASLTEFDRRRLYLAEGYSSLYEYCTRRLGLSEYAAYSRIQAARLSHRFPAVLRAFTRGEITLTTIGLLGKYLNEQNYLQLLHEARHASRREVEMIVARLNPMGASSASVRRLPVLRPVVIAPGSVDHATPSDSSRAGLWEAGGDSATGQPKVDPTVAQRSEDGSLQGVLQRDSSASPASVAVFPGATVSGPDSPRHDVETANAEAVPRGQSAIVGGHGNAADSVPSIVAGECYRLHVTLSREGHDRLRRLRDLLRHAVPDGNLDVIVDRAITHLLVQTEKRRMARASRPRQTKRQVRAGSRRIPAHVQRAVWERDGARCAFVGRHGRCTARAFLEMHHVVPFAAGGKATVDNIQLRCRAHNSYEAEKYFGKKHAKAASRR